MNSPLDPSGSLLGYKKMDFFNWMFYLQFGPSRL